MMARQSEAARLRELLGAMARTGVNGVRVETTIRTVPAKEGGGLQTTVVATCASGETSEVVLRDAVVSTIRSWLSGLGVHESDPEGEESLAEAEGDEPEEGST
jgi:hypothetical protein